VGEEEERLHEEAAQEICLLVSRDGRRQVARVRSLQRIQQAEIGARSIWRGRRGMSVAACTMSAKRKNVVGA